MMKKYKEIKNYLILICFVFTCLAANKYMKTSASAEEATDASSEVTTETVTEVSTEKPTTEEMTTEKPTTEATTEKQTTEATTEKPTTEAITEKPTTEKPTTEATTEKPTTEKPTTEVTTEKPTTAATTEQTPAWTVEEKPTTEATTEKPTTEAATEKATTEETTENATTEETLKDASDTDATKTDAIIDKEEKHISKKNGFLWILILAVILGVIALTLVLLDKNKKAKLAKVEKQKESIDREKELIKRYESDNQGVKISMVLKEGGNTDRIIDTHINSSIIVGRSDLCDVYIDNEALSRQHFAIEYDGESFYVQDLDTTNGTTLNGVKLTHKRRLEKNDKLGVGSFEIVVRW